MAHDDHQRLRRQDNLVNSVRYRVVNPWGLHARPAAAVACIAQTCARDWEVVAVKHSEEVDAKSILGLLLLADNYFLAALRPTHGDGAILHASEFGTEKRRDFYAAVNDRAGPELRQQHGGRRYGPGTPRRRLGARGMDDVSQ